MHLFTTLSLLVATASTVIASSSSLAALPQLTHLSALLHRQSVEPGTPLYECHYDCGYAILGASSSSTDSDTAYCTNSTWLGLLDGCLDCAGTYDIWQYYGDDVSSAAEACGLTASPSSSSSSAGTASATATASVSESGVGYVNNGTAAVTPTATATAASATSLGTGTTASATTSASASSTASSAAGRRAVPWAAMMGVLAGGAALLRV